MMNINNNLFYSLLLVLLLTGLICFSTPIFSEETKKNIIESGIQPGRRVLPAKKQDKNRTKADGYAKLKLDGVLMWDYDQFNGVHLSRAQEDYQVSNETKLRRARIDIESRFYNDWQGELQVSFEDEDKAPEIGDAYIAFTGWEDITLTVGQTKEPFGLEELTGSSNITFIERSMATSVFAPGYNPGLGLSWHQGPLTWAIGVFEAADRENKGDTYALTSRFVFNPWDLKNHILHIGIAGSVRDFAGEMFEIEERAEVHTAETIVRSVQTSADDVHLLGLEFVWVMGPFSLQAEHMKAMIKASAGNDPTYVGYYLQISYFLTGESRVYKKGVFGRIKPVRKYGALELVSRYSLLDAEDKNRGVRAENLTLGVNYYLNKNVRLMFNYIKTNLIDCVSKVEGKADAISLRTQYSF